MQCRWRLAYWRTLPLSVPAQGLVTDDVGSDVAVGGGVVSHASVVLRAIHTAVPTQQLPRAEMPRYRHRYRRRATFQTIAVAVTVAKAARDAAQEGFRPLPVSEERKEELIK